MNIEKLTERVRGFVQSAQSLRGARGPSAVHARTYAESAPRRQRGLAAGLIDAPGGNSREALTATELALAKLPKVQGSGAGQLYMTPATARIFDQAEKIAEKAGDSTSPSSGCCSRSPWRRRAMRARSSPTRA